MTPKYKVAYGVNRGKYQCTADLLFDLFLFDQTVVYSTLVE